jgi:hypothetical protein
LIILAVPASSWLQRWYQPSALPRLSALRRWHRMQQHFLSNR